MTNKQFTLDLWSYLAKNPRSKPRKFFKKSLPFKHQWPRAMCPACEEAMDHAGYSNEQKVDESIPCNFCPVTFYPSECLVYLETTRQKLTRTSAKRKLALKVIESIKETWNE